MIVLLGISLPRVIAFVYYLFNTESIKSLNILFWVKVITSIPQVIIYFIYSILILSIRSSPDAEDHIADGVRIILIILYIIPQGVLILLDFYHIHIIRLKKNELLTA